MKVVIISLFAGEYCKMLEEKSVAKSHYRKWKADYTNRFKEFQHNFG